MPSKFFKCYATFWSGSMASEAPHTKLVFLGLLSLADEFGRVQAGIHSIAQFVGVPFADAAEAMRRFQEPDPESTSDAEEGRRVLKVRNNVWQLVNFDHYRALNYVEERREQDAERQRRARIRRKEQPLNQEERDASRRVTESHGSLCAKTKGKRKTNSPPAPPQGEVVVEVVSRLNAAAGRRYDPAGKWPELAARLKGGATQEECKLVVDFKVAEWAGTDMAKYLNPATLFRASKWPVYLADALQWAANAPAAGSAKSLVDLEVFSDPDGRRWFKGEGGIKTFMPDLSKVECDA